MELTRLRKTRDDLIEILSDCENDEFGRVDSDLLEYCAKGEIDSLDEFKAEHFREPWDDPEGKKEWESETHKNFYYLCHEIAALEQKTYKEAFQ